MKSDLVSLHEMLRQLQFNLLQSLAQIPSELTRSSDADQVDSGYLLREMASIADDIRKACNTKKDLLSKVLAMKAGAAAAQGQDLVLRGELASASPDVVTKPKLPRTGSPEWIALMRYLGCDDAQLESNLLRPSFREVGYLMKSMMEEGKQPPPGVSVMSTDAVVVFRSRFPKKKDNGQENEF